MDTATLLSRGIYPVRVGVAPPRATINPVGEWEVLHPPSGEEVSDVGPRASRILRGHRDEGFLTTSFDRQPEGYHFNDSAETHAYRVKQACMLTGMLNSGDRLGIAETDDASKMCLQRGAALGWDLIIEGLGMEPAGDIAPGLLAIKGQFRDSVWATGFSPRATLPVATMSGSFDYASGFRSKLMHTFAGIVGQVEGWDALQHLHSDGASALGGIQRIHAMLLTRTGPLNKALPALMLTPGEVQLIGSIQGLCPRRRWVFGVPTMVNVALLRAATQVKEGTKLFPSFDHTKQELMLSKLRGFLRRCEKGGVKMKTLSDDISGYDQSVRGHHQEALGRILYSHCFSPAELEVWLQAHKMPVLGPTWGLGKGGYLYTRDDKGGVTTSGLITTSMDGVWICAARLLMCAGRAMNLTPQQALEQLWITWAFLEWGDDVVLVVPDSFDEDKYVRESERLGYKCKLLSTTVFLKRYMTEDFTTATGLISRGWLNRIWGEYPKAGWASEMVSLGDALVSLGPHPQREALMDLIKVGMPKLKGLSVDDAIGVSRDPSVILMAQEELKRDPMSQRRFLARFDRPMANDDVAALSVATGLLGQPGSTRINPAALKETVASAKAKFYEMLEWVSGGRKPHWYKETVNLTKAFKIGEQYG